MKIFFSENAEKNIRLIWKFNCSINRSFAKRIQKKMYEEIRALSIFPNSGPVETLLKKEPETYRYLIVAEGRYKIIYTVEVERIIIHTVFDCRRNPNKLTH